VDKFAGLFFLALPLLLLFLLFSRARGQQRALASAQAAIQPGLRVMTTSGVHARVVSNEDDAIVVLEIAPGVHTRWARQAIAEVFENDESDEDDDEHTDDEHQENEHQENEHQENEVDDTAAHARTATVVDLSSDGIGSGSAVPEGGVDIVPADGDRKDRPLT
jgi:preprotein translocase YajC subunit